MATMVYALDGKGPKNYDNTLNSFLTKRDNDVFWQIGADMDLSDIADIQNSNLQQWNASNIFVFSHLENLSKVDHEMSDMHVSLNNEFGINLIPENRKSENENFYNIDSIIASR